MTDKKPAVLRSQEIMFYRTPNHNDVRIEILLKDENVWMLVISRRGNRRFM